jgi:hypothetical protein
VSDGSKVPSLSKVAVGLANQKEVQIRRHIKLRPEKFLFEKGFNV